MIYLRLFIEFFKIGLFSFGGGYATIPFLYNLSEQYGWYSTKELSNMVAVAAITPGPVGINVATYAGLNTSGIFGSLVATISEMVPSLILVVFVSKLLIKFNDNFYVKSLIETLKPISCALLLSVSVVLIQSSVTDKFALSLLVILLIISWKSKRDPIFYVFISAFMGVIVYSMI